MRGVSTLTILLALPGCAVLFGMFIVPGVMTAVRSVTDPVPGLGNYEDLLASGTYAHVGITTLWLSVSAVVAVVFLGTPVAYALARNASHLVVRLTLLFVVLSFFSSSLVRTYAWLVILGESGPVVGLAELLGLPVSNILFSPTAVLIGMVHYLLPVFVLSTFAGIRNIPWDLVQSAEVLGATHSQALRTVYLPLARPSIVNAATIVYVIAIGFFITPAILGGASETMLSQLISQSVQRFGDFGFASATAVVLLGVTLLLIAFAQFVGHGRHKGLIR